MLAKLETKSNRVKGLSFHPTRPWVLASLHNGVVQLWDYRIRTLVDKFDEHDGPVRGICFHPTQPLFVSGGDDYKIKVWNYKQRRCLFTLLGHLDYIRTVQFHHEYPWILSASDDQTIRIWNWQSRTCIAVLTGHNHYVMCASFHPKEDLVVSASLDQTVRVWDISGLRKKNVAPSSSIPHHDDSMKFQQNDIFGNSDAIVKYVLEGHDRGVNWAAFHPTSPLIVSGADDRQVKLWRMNETRVPWEVDTFRGHFNNVSCVLFHPRQELIISNSEDKTIRVWDIQKRSGIQTFRREHDRFWILAAHPEQNLFAAGHDSGMIVFKLERERPAYASFHDQSLFYVKDKFVREFQYASGRDVPVLPLKTKSGASSGRLRTLAYSAEDRAILVSSDADGGTYELYQIPKDSRTDSAESRRGLGVNAVFLGRKRFAVLDKSHQIVIRDFMNEEVKKFAPGGSVDNIFTAPVGFILLRSEDRVSLFDVQQRKSVAEISIPEVKYVYWTNDKRSIALVSEDTVVIANKKLEQLCSIHENVRIKSGAWDESGVFIYSTSTHIKYCLTNGDNGIVRTLDSPLYINSIIGNKVYCLDRECKNRIISIDTTEFMFKHALIQRQYSVVLKMVKEYNLIGTAIISYLQRKGFPEVALYFVKDEKTRFNLALECGNIEIALESAKVLDEKESWNRLGTEALRQGNHQIVEMAYQRTKNFEKLSFLYLITGNIDKLRKMLKISEMRGDVMSRYHNALYLGEIGERVRIMEEVGQLPLAYATAIAHGLTEQAEAIAAKAAALTPDLDLPQPPKNPQLLIPPIPVLRLHESNWPLLNVSKGYFDGPGAAHHHKEGAEEEKRLGFSSDAQNHQYGGEAPQWDELDISEEGEEGREGAEPSDETPQKSEWDLDLEIEDVEPIPGTSSGGKSSGGDKSFVVLPNPGPSIQQIWTGNSDFAADHAAAGSFESAMKLLNQQIAAVNFAPLKPLFMGLYNGSRASLPTFPSIPSLVTPIHRGALENGIRSSLPVLSLNLQRLIEVQLKAAYKATYDGKFADALSLFTAILQTIPLLVVESKKEVSEAKELAGICREYITGLRMQIARASVDPVRQAELAAYFTHCSLEPVHLALVLSLAMNSAYKIKNFLLASGFARRLLELNPAENQATQARKVIKFAEQNPSNSQQINYNERNPFVICGHSLTPIYKGSPSVACPLCQTSYLPQYKDKLCATCSISQIGGDASGLQIMQQQQRDAKPKRGSAKSKQVSRNNNNDDDDEDDDAW